MYLSSAYYSHQSTYAINVTRSFRHRSRARWEVMAAVIFLSAFTRSRHFFLDLPYTLYPDVFRLCYNVTANLSLPYMTWKTGLWWRCDRHSKPTVYFFLKLTRNKREKKCICGELWSILRLVLGTHLVRLYQQDEEAGLGTMNPSNTCIHRSSNSVWRHLMCPVHARERIFLPLSVEERNLVLRFTYAPWKLLVVFCIE